MPKKDIKKRKTESKTEVAVPGGGQKASAAQSENFPIVGLGASAGGLEALRAFFSKVPEDSGMAYIVVVHMTPKQPSMMPELLQKVARIPVRSAEDGEEVLPNHVYVVLPDKEMSIYQGRIQLLDVVDKTISLPIDFFLRSLARDQGAHAAAVILSGTGTDGTLGLKDVNAEGGLVVVQSEQSAGYAGMPQSAVATGLVDMVLSPEEMPGWLAEYFTHTANKVWPKHAEHRLPSEQRGWLQKIFAILRAQVGHDFSAYKVNTMQRRIHRRMGLNQIASHDGYVRYMRENPAEVEALFRDLLIGVTNFFRDIESFDVLNAEVLPDLLARKSEDSVFRAWIPGCSTGEEVYSLAIVLSECLEERPKRVTLQLFGTDIDSYAIDKAREGLFPDSIAADMSPERLQRFFHKEGNFFRVCKEVRDSVVFSVQDLLRDPPFSRLDLLCCRNVLIYLNAEAQKKLLPLFHYTLNPGGILVLGSSETIGGFTNLFEVVDKKWKIYRRLEVPQSLRHIVEFPRGLPQAPDIQTAPALPLVHESHIGQLTQKAILEQFTPTSVLVSVDGDILYVHGRSGRYLEPPSGLPSNNILDLAREGLRLELSSTFRSAKSAQKRITRQRVAVKTNGDLQLIDLHVCPLTRPKELLGRFLVVFEDLHLPAVPTDKIDHTDRRMIPGSFRIAELERELQSTRESHQTTIEELESSNEELKSTNEELQSANEELQSTNEELESSKEELQSLNEELHTVNAELQSKVEELSATQADMHNLLNSTEIATIFVDNDMCVRRFTPEASTMVNLIQTDIGRPLHHVVSNLKYEKMIQDVRDVQEKLSPREIEVQTVQGIWYTMRIMPYKTTDNRIEGAVITFSCIDEQKKAQEKLQATIAELGRAWELVRSVFDIIPEPMLVLDRTGTMVLANTAFADLLSLSLDEMHGKDLFKVVTWLQEQPDLQANIQTALADGVDFTSDRFDMPIPGGTRSCAVMGRIIRADTDAPSRILLYFQVKR